MARKINGWTLTAAGMPRTGDSGLTDDELMVCDAIFDRPAAVAMVMSDDYGIAFNLPYQPWANSSRRAALLKSMLERKLILEYPHSIGPTIGLTATGGALWEQERRPVWPAYWFGERGGVIMEDWNSPVQGNDLLTITATRRDTAETALRVSVDAGLYIRRPGPVEVSEVGAAPIVSWKIATVVTMRVPISIDQRTRPDWSRFESQRTFWRTIPELLRSHRVLAGRSDSPTAPPLSCGG